MTSFEDALKNSASFWNVFIKFRWHDQKLITGQVYCWTQSYSKAALIFLCNIYISNIAKANPFEDARVEEEEELLERAGKCILDKT